MKTKLLFVFLCSCLAIKVSATVIYVDDDATGTNSGTSWINAFVDLQSALSIAISGDEIWVADGLYKPTSTTNRNIAFVIEAGVEVYGGFGGFETQRSQRDWELFSCILSGAIGSGSTNTDNSKVVVRMEGTGSNLLDGFHVRRAYRSSTDTGIGAAVSVASENATIRHCEIYENEIFLNAAVHLFIDFPDSAIAYVDNCLIRDNTSFSSGAIGAGGSNCRLDITSSTIVQNTSGGINSIITGYSGVRMDMTNSIVWNNIGNSISTSWASTISNCIIENGYTSDGNDISLNEILNTDPLFLEPNIDDFTLPLFSPARNSGDNTFSDSNKDLAHEDRIYDGIIDLGCYENTTPPIYFVDLNASGLNNGTSWIDAYTDLHEALNNAIEGQQVWVANGIYFSSYFNDPAASFVLKNNVPVYGGFAGGETSLDERNWFDNVATLSGNIGNIASATDNAWHVVFADDPEGNFYIDGFLISGGYADGVGSHEDIGGGVLVEYTTGTFTMNNCFLLNNHTDYTGGAITTFANSVFNNCSFFANDSHIGAAIDWSNGTYIENCLFVNNTADIGIVNHNFTGTIDMRGCTFEGNTVLWEFYTVVEGGGGSVSNTVIWGNTIDETEEAINGVDDVHHCILQGDELSLAVEGIEVYYEDPLFVDAAGNDFSLMGNSVGFNNGDNVMVTLSNDVLGVSRILYNTVDFGAIEGKGVIPGITFVDADATGANDGTSWVDAFTDLQDGINIGAVNTEVWVAEGIYKPTTTTNRELAFILRDSLELYGGFSGNEFARSERDWSMHSTVISGNIGDVGQTDNSKYLIYCNNDHGVVIDGFEITGAFGDITTSGSGGIALSLLNFSTATIRHCNVHQNVGYYGSACFLSNSQVVLDNCLFHDNSINSGGIINITGGIEYVNLISSCTLAGNHSVQASSSGIGGASYGQFDISNTIIWGNANPQSSIGPDCDITNCIIEGFIPGGNDTIVGTVYTTINPLFANVNIADYSLLPGSIGINTGNNASVLAALDRGHNLRIQDGTVDIGCYESADCSQINDVCSSAFSIMVNDEPYTGTNKCATGGDSPSNPCAASTGKSVWYKFIAPANGEVEIILDYQLSISASFNPRIALYSGTCDAMNYISCVNANGAGLDETMTAIGLTQGAEYFLRVDAPGSQEGYYELEILSETPICPGDFDNNGAVNVNDLLIMTGSFGCASACGVTDMDNNGAVNIGDLLQFTALFGTICY